MAMLLAGSHVALALLLSGCLFIVAVSGVNGIPKKHTLPLNAQVVKPLLGRRYHLACTSYYEYDFNTSSIRNYSKPCIPQCRHGCESECLVLCPNCQKSYCMCDYFPGSLCGDPRFTGADGNNLYFHGKKDHDFCILSDNNVHINAHFIGKHNPEGSRDFTWIQALGIIFGDNHKLYIGVEKTMTWDDSIDHLTITFDGESVDILPEANAIWNPKTVPSLFIIRTSETNGIMVQLRGVFTIIGHAVPITKKESDIHSYGVTPDDSLAHFDLSFKFHALGDDVHGVLGQTYRPDYVNKLDVEKNMPIMTGAANFSSSTIFATDCAVARYHNKPEIAMVTEKADK